MNRPARGIAALVIAVMGMTMVSATASAQKQRTQNGYPVIPKSRTVEWKAGGTAFYTAPGKPTEVLRDFTRWFDRNIEPISRGGADDWSWSPVRTNKLGPSISNHASGTAVDLNATLHPLGERNTFTREQRVKILRKVNSYKGHLRWGGTYRTPDDMHFEYQSKRSNR